jgi:hypothetical protein
MKKVILIIMAIVLMSGCKEKPVEVDRSGKDQFVVIDTTGILEKDPSTGLRLLKNETIRFICQDYNMSFEFKTNDMGIVYASGLPASKYTISVNKQIGDNYSIFGSKDKNIFGNMSIMDTLYLKSALVSSIIINEIFYAGSVNTLHYMFDFYVELYNNSDDIKYMDGIVVCRVASGLEADGGIAIVNLDGVYGVKLTYAFQFPGTPGGNEYPIYPGQFVVVAGDAIDHRNIISTSIDLSPKNPIFKNGDPNYAQLWEFYNEQGGDIDIAGVPNVKNILSRTTVDFLPSVTNDAIIISSGKKGLIYSGASDIYIDLSTVLDGIQYMTDPTKTRKIDSRIDAGNAGTGLGAYSGKSVERRVADINKPKKHFDSNNSTIDMGINEAPTPGYQGNPK